MIDVLTFQLFRRHVAHRAHDRAGIGIHLSCWHFSLRRSVGRGGELGQTKIKNLHAAIVGDEDVVGFDVSMNDTFLVRRGEAFGDLQCVVSRFALRQRAAGHPLAQRLTF